MHSTGPGGSQPNQDPIIADADAVQGEGLQAQPDAPADSGEVGDLGAGELLSPDQSDAAAEPAPSEPSYMLSGALATSVMSMTVAVVTSYTGTQGTVIGAATGAIIGSFVSQMARTRLMRFERRVYETSVTMQRLGWSDVLGLTRTAPAAIGQAIRRLPFRTIGIVSGLGIAGFVLSMGAITSLEASRGEPLSAITTGEPATGTTIGRFLPPIVAAIAPTSSPTAEPAIIADSSPEASPEATTDPLVSLSPAAEPGASPAVSPAAGTPDSTQTPAVTDLSGSGSISPAPLAAASPPADGSPSPSPEGTPEMLSPEPAETPHPTATP